MKKTFTQAEDLKIGERGKFATDNAAFNVRIAKLGIQCWVDKRKPKPLTEGEKALNKFINLGSRYTLVYGFTLNGRDFDCGDMPRDLGTATRAIEFVSEKSGNADLRNNLQALPDMGDKVVTEDGEGCLNHHVYRGLKCGCRVIGNGTFKFPMTVSQCAAHASEQSENAELRNKLQDLTLEKELLTVFLKTLVDLHEGVDNGGGGILAEDWQNAKAALARIT